MNSTRYDNELKSAEKPSVQEKWGQGKSVEKPSVQEKWGKEKSVEEKMEGQAGEKKIRCIFCNKKTGLINYSCGCGGIFCQKHRYTHSHNCKMIKDKKEKTKEIIKKAKS